VNGANIVGSFVVSGEMSLTRSRTPPVSVQVGVDSDTEVPPSSPSPPPAPVTEECHRSSHAA